MNIKHLITDFNKRLLMLVVAMCSVMSLQARDIDNSSQKINSTGIDEHGVFVEFLVKYYCDRGSDNVLNSSTWYMDYNGKTVILFKTQTEHQNDAAEYWSYFQSANFPMYIRPYDTSGNSTNNTENNKRNYYFPGSNYWNGGTNGSYTGQKVSCKCAEYGSAYVKVYLPKDVWGKWPTFRVTTTWETSSYSGTISLGQKYISNPNIYFVETKCEPSTTTGKMKATIQFSGVLDNRYTYTPSNLSYLTLTDKTPLDVVGSAYDKSYAGEYTASKSAQKDNVDITMTQKNTTKYTQTLYSALNGGGKSLTFPIYHGYTESFSVDLAACTYVKNLSVTPNQLDKSFTLVWDKQVMNNITAGTFYIYRYDVQNDGSLANRKVIKEKQSFTDCTITDTDASLQYDKKYKYVVCFVANSWQTVEEPIMALADSKEATITRSFKMELSTSSSSSGIVLNWSYPATKNNTQTVYTIYRKSGSGNYAQISTKTVTDNAAGSATYTDPANNIVSQTIYTYKVETNVMSKTFSSNEATGCMTDMSKVTEMSATKGEFSNVVKLTWKGSQVGAGLTQYKVLRKVIDSEDDYKQIYVTEGTAETYNYDDVTALSGQYYTYKVETWVNKVMSNYKTDEGFCTSKGIISGRITYGTGTAVPDVKVMLTPDNIDDGNAQFHSMYVSANGGGLQIPLTNTLRSMFGSGGAFSIEMWVRPNQFITKPLHSGTNSISPSTINAGSDDAAVVMADQSNTTNGGNLVGGDGNLVGGDGDDGQIIVDPIVDPIIVDPFKGCSANPYLFTVSGVFGVAMKQNSLTSDSLILYLPNGKHLSNVTIVPNTFNHVTLTYSGNGKWTISVIDGDSVRSQSFDCASPTMNEGHKYIYFGRDMTQSDDGTFKGYIDDVRIWSKSLTSKEILKYGTHVLSGSESGLKVYLPMDEGLKNQTKVYDYSKTGGVANSNHGIVLSSTSSSTIVPTEDQLALYGQTDEQGNFTVMGVPYTGEGTSYIVRPVYGVHEFSPHYLNRFINANSLNHNGVDFEDVSSFSVSGKVLYENTDYPVEGCNIYVDGTICAREGTPIETDADGKFTISVPIGSHYINIKKNGHEFMNKGRYPADSLEVGTLFTFTKDISSGQPLMFYDKTLVNFTGRVVGGDIQGDKPLGFGLSRNNLGVAEIVIVPTSDAYNLNYDNQAGEKGTSTISCQSASENISSSSWRGAGSGNENKKIYIKTDSLTGEFSAMIPPLTYKFESIRIISNSEVLFSNLPTFDLSNPLDVSSDTLPETGELYEYNYALRQTYHSDPIFSVTQKGADMGAFGIRNYELWENETKYDVQVYHKDGNGKLAYDYDYPLFVSGDQYIFNLRGYELYINHDGDVHEEDCVPLSGTVVTIKNALSDSQAVFVGSGTTTEGQNVSAGDVYDLKENELALDSLGLATYTWKAGLPNISGDFTRTISMSFAIAGQNYDWAGTKGIVLGSLPTGNNFVTAGPDHLAMILRDPPGTNSKASWTNGQITSYSHSEGGCWSMDASVSFTTMFGAEVTTGAGVGYIQLNSVESHDDLETGTRVTTEGEDANTNSISISSSKTVSTKDTPEYVGAGGDVFIGTATNIIFGEANNVGLYRNPDNNKVSLDMKSVMTVGQKFGTVFQYDQLYIENTLLPNLVKLRNSMLKYYGNDPVPVNKTKNLQYVSRLPEDDPNFGSSNYDKDIWGSAAIAPGDSLSLRGKSYYLVMPENASDIDILVDSVNWCNLQIDAWKGYLAQNEEEKVKAFEEREKYLEDNLSFDTGADVEQVYETSTSTGTTYEHKTGASVILNNKIGLTINSTGVLFNVQTETGGYRHSQTAHEDTEVATFSYTLSEEGDDDAITVDIYKYGDYSRIFRTRGGQTCNPYEGEVRTKYYQPDQYVIMEATQQIEKPDIAVDKAIVSNVPTGSAANFTLTLSNFSEIGEDVYYKLLVVDESNKNGARILIDGQPLTEGRNIKVPASTPLTKSLQLYQSDPSILDYEDIAIVLASQTQYDPTSTWDQIADTVKITAHFVPSSSPVTMELDKTLVNTNSVTTSSPDPLLNITFKGFDRNYYNQKAFRIQYHAQGENDWRLLREYLIDKSKANSSSQEYLQDVASVTYQLNMKNMDDGQYTFRVLSVCSYGLSDEITVSSEEITVTKDMNRPQVLGTPKPSTGILTQGDDIAITFNEDINSNMLTDSNFKITAQLNEATIANDVAVLSNGESEPSAHTEADINLSGKDFAMDMWVNVSDGKAGTLVAHGNGTNKFKVGVDADGYVIVNIGDNEYKSDNKLKTDYWCYLALNYSTTDSTDLLSANYAYDAETVKLFSSRQVADYTGNGRLSVLSGINASLHDLTLWNEARPLYQLQSEMYVTKKPSTEGLIGYWRFDEGSGLSAADKARNRNMVVADGNSWYLNTENNSVQLTGSNYVNINTSACSVLSSDDYALEMWFLANSQQPTASSQQPTVFSVGNNIALRFVNNGQLELSSNGFRLNLGSKAYNDAQWHHFALNVLRNGSTTAYIDGEAVAQTSSKNIGYMQSDALTLGAQRSYDVNTGYTFGGYFNGAIDDVRIWNATMNASLLRGSKDTRLAGNEDGLVAYYPFENLETDQFNQLVTVAYPIDKVSGKAIVTSNEELQFVGGPAQTPAKSLSGVGFNFVASERTIVINLTEAADLVEGTTVNLTVRDVRDMNGNYSEPIKWTAYINKNQLVWKDNEVNLKYEMGSAAQFSATVKNNSAVTEQWSVSGLPSWLDADMTQGTLTALTSQTINFTVGDDVQIGTHELTLFLSGNNGIKVPLSVMIIVTGDEPEWVVNPADFENNMTIFGQIKIKGKISENTGDKIAAFVDGECRGVGSPVYYPRYDRYFTQIMVYGNNESGKPVEFKVWNASEGKVYPVVSCYHNGKSAAVAYTENADLGTASVPFVWDAENKIEETLALQNGWNWTSLYVQNDDMSVGNMLSGINAQGNTVKSFDTYAQSDGNLWSGSLSNMNVGEMYMIKSVSADVLTMTGTEVDAQSTPITVTQNWNWIGLNASYKISLNDAFAELTPETDDVVKSQTAFATYDGYEWIGRLTALVPGQGYMYKSYADGDKVFKYPSRASVTGSLTKERADGIVMDALFDMDRSVYYSYPNNMTIVARVMDGDNVVGDAQVGVFDGDKCRDASAVGDKNLVFLIVPGDKSESLRLEVVSGNQRYTLSQSIGFEVNGSLGTVENPYIIQIGSGATSIEDIDTSADDTESYNTAGLKVGKGYKGVIIKNGEKHFDRK